MVNYHFLLLADFQVVKPISVQKNTEKKAPKLHGCMILWDRIPNGIQISFHVEAFCSFLKEY